MQNIQTIKPAAFPPQLLEISEPPAQLYIRGVLPPKDAIYLAVVGSRKYTSYGKEVCEKIIRDLAGTNIVIISGLALGIDAIAHRTALEAKLTTIAFPGSGLNDSVLYPAANFNLAKKIIERGGTLISEFKPDFKATPYSFPQRNRLMAGISRGVLIIEAEEKSGTLITARLATEYNRDVFAVPGSIFSPQSKGIQQLLRLGATPVSSGEDILEHWNIKRESGIKNNGLRIMENCSEKEKKVIALLNEPITKDELIQKLALPIHEAHALISAMEIKGIIVESRGEMRMNF
ncbi:MAG: DNA-protecting protein DprA [Parcubacteria group bacterium]|nr:DNA-protecting protein DprA [Parcubacteria group bacterium]